MAQAAMRSFAGAQGLPRRAGQLEEIQQGDFYGILKAMAGKPAVIRLLDPPLHEFLPIV